MTGLRSSPRLVNPKDKFYADFGELALHECTFYLCSKCDKPYFVGMLNCREEMRQEAEQKRPEDLMCN